MMTNMQRSLRSIRSLSTKRTGRSTKGDAAYESHMQAATVRHRRNRARTKEKKKPEIKAPPERFRKIPSRNSDTQIYRSKRLGASGGLTKSARNVHEASGAKRSGLASAQKAANTSKQPNNNNGSKSASSVVTSERRWSSSPSKGSLLLVLGLTSGCTAWILRHNSEMEESFTSPVVQKYIEEARQLLRAEAKPKEIKQETSNEPKNHRGWFASLWRRS